MNRFLEAAGGRLLLAALLIASTACSDGFAEDKQADTNRSQFVVSLTDGTRLVSTPLIAGVQIKTSYATLTIPFEKILKATFDAEKKTVAIQLVNGDQLQGESTMETLKVSTAIGTFAIPMVHIQEIAGSREDAVKIDDNPERRNACINNLRMIDAAKEQWAMANHSKDGDVVDINGILEYVKGQKLPVCPCGGTYKVNAVGQYPECSVRGHTFGAGEGHVR